MLLKIKLKSFGLAEAVVASVVVIIVLSAAVSLSGNTIKTTEVNAAYTQAQHISDGIFESINLIKSSGQVYFDESMRAGQMIKIDCFDSQYFHSDAQCSAGIDAFPLDKIPFVGADYISDSDGYYSVSSAMLDSPAFGENYFSYQVKVSEPEGGCYSSDEVEIPAEKCRIVLTDVKWEETSGVKHYRQGMYLTDWER